MALMSSWMARLTLVTQRSDPKLVFGGCWSLDLSYPESHPHAHTPKSTTPVLTHNSRVLRRSSPRLEFSGSHFISFP